MMVLRLNYNDLECVGYMYQRIGRIDRYRGFYRCAILLGCVIVHDMVE